MILQDKAVWLVFIVGSFFGFGIWQGDSFMNCWHCGTELIWGGDHSPPEEEVEGGEYCMVTNLSCPQCKSYVEVYLPKGAS